MKLSERLEAAIAIVDDSTCRCHEAYVSRGMMDPNCNHDTAEAIATLRESAAALRAIGGS